MLDSVTKGRIDSARDILVGKVPDPKSQVEQITIALIYKFMYDMDCQSEELGGKPSFFTGEFKKYRWSQLLDKRLSGHERLILYAEGIERMNQNKNIPQLFRDIFKGVFLPYRDPETLNLFLKEIDGFSYDHSERLGDAFEYLLSVLGTQGDAGQFRTPRHIIDFIVAVVDPKKNETVLDPACGTAGFLVSSFKHILRASSNQKSKTRGERSRTSDNRQSELTPDERARLMTNFRGYDIAPDMVRLSRANLYLHGFPNPVIHEYDTLTSEERWDERCDVILANPPFMTPKGGIRPHNRFSIKAKRSEVLFVDYIAEHLNPGGRAGIIVPEGIIFQSQNAYKALRKMLVENYLWAVVSLPAGVFNPYAGVKTSVLFLDRNLAKRADEVLFAKVESDGFDLGAQRRSIEKNDLPGALKTLCDFKTHGSVNRKPEIENQKFLTVSRKRLLESSDISLSGERYRDATSRSHAIWPLVKLGEVTDISSGSRPKGGAVSAGVVSVGGEHIASEYGFDFSSPKYIPESFFRKLSKGILQRGDVLVVKDGATTGKTAFVDRSFPYVVAAVNEHVFILRPRATKILPPFLYHLVRSKAGQKEILRHKVGAAQGGINLSIVRIQIPLPPLAEQEKIVAELEGYRKVIEAARQIISSYKPMMRIRPTWPVKKMAELIVGKPRNGYSGKPVNYATNTKVLSLSATTKGYLDPTKFKYLKDNIPADSHAYCAKGDILLQRGNTRDLVGTAALFNIEGAKFIYPDLMIRVRANEEVVLPEYLIQALRLPEVRGFIKNNASGSAGSMPKINQRIVEAIPIPVPPIAEQHQIVKELEAERTLVDANRELIDRIEARIQAKLSEVWGDEGE